MSEYQNPQNATSTCRRSTVYRLPRGFRLQFTLAGHHVACEWQPCVPSSDAVAHLIRPYLRARDNWLRTLGGNIAVVRL